VEMAKGDARKGMGAELGGLKFSGALLPGNITHPAASSHSSARLE